MKIGTRKSRLAMVQTEMAAEAIKTAFPSVPIEINGYETKGDQQLNRSLAAFGSKGAFTKELETAMLEGRIDLAVHSAKDLPVELPEGLKESDKLPEPIYTPSTKAEIGDHDENISYEQSIAHLEKYFPGRGEELAAKLRDNTIALYKKCAEYALSKGIIIADTKFEFGLDKDGNMVIGDEMLTPDSSRFWPAEGYEPGHGQPSFDKQFARDWLKANPDNDWTLPQDIVDKTIGKYLQGYEMLTGKKL